MLKSMFATAVALTTIASAAMAADLPAPIPVKAPPPVFAGWSGLYLGVQAGYGWGNSTLFLPGTGHFSTLDPSGGFGGLHIGYDHTFAGGLVLGARGEVNWANLDGGAQPISGNVGTQTAEGLMRFNGAVVGRLGYQLAGWMPYAVGGWAFGNYRHTVIDISANDPFNGSASSTFNGYTAGAGLDYTITRNWVAGVEYRYTDYGTHSYPFGVISGHLNQHTVNLTTNDVRGTLSYRF